MSRGSRSVTALGPSGEAGAVIREDSFTGFGQSLQ